MRTMVSRMVWRSVEAEERLRTFHSTRSSVPGEPAAWPPSGEDEDDTASLPIFPRSARGAVGGPARDDCRISPPNSPQSPENPKRSGLLWC